MSSVFLHNPTFFCLKLRFVYMQIPNRKLLAKESNMHKYMQEVIVGTIQVL